MLSKLKIRLIDNWHCFFKFWSVKIDLISLFISTYAVTFPDAVIAAWSNFPPEFKSMLPQEYLPYISMSLLVLSLIARSIKQPKLKAENEPVSNS